MYHVGWCAVSLSVEAAKELVYAAPAAEVLERKAEGGAPQTCEFTIRKAEGGAPQTCEFTIRKAEGGAPQTCEFTKLALFGKGCLKLNLFDI